MPRPIVPHGSDPARVHRIGLAAALAILSVALSALPRILLAAGALPAAAQPFVWSDVLATYVDRLAGGRIPYAETFFEYPPAIGYLAGALGRIAPGPAAYVALWAAASALAAAAVALLLARAAGPWRAIVFWSLSPQLLLYGAMNFDALAAAFLVSALLLARAARPLAGIASLAIGATVKGFPAVALPFEVARLARERGARAAVGGALLFAAVVLVIAAPSLLAPYPLSQSAAYVASLTNFDSAWGLVLGALRALGVGGAETVVALASTAGAIVTYVYALVRRPAADGARLALLGLLAVLIWTRLYSPQYSLWLVPLFALAGTSVRTLALLAIADVLVFATVYPLTLVPWPETDPRATLLFGALAVGIVLRHAALILAWRELWRPREWHPVGG